MSKFKQEQEVKVSKYPIWSNQELREFEKELEAFRVHKKLKSGEAITYIDFDAYLISVGALSKDGAVKIFNLYKETDICLWLVLSDKYDQLGMLKMKTQFAKRKELEMYQEIVNNSNIIS